MKRRTVTFSVAAKRDLLRIYDWVAGAAGDTLALGYTDRIVTWCTELDLASERGQRRDDLRPGLRVAGFERRVVVAFTVDDARVTVLRIFYGGQDWERDFVP